ncbi:hypothetical protein F5Y09DRAFT_118736 [Xylaria sp. FL1042]|nr:hypothetical protein F5Y09DRAFT_118736 [Xylaria sp. FL1042]
MKKFKLSPFPQVGNFCRQYLSKQGTGLCVPLQEFTHNMVAHISETEAAVRAIASKLASDIAYCGSHSIDDPHHFWPGPSPTEISKISTSLYIMGIIQLLFPQRPSQRYERWPHLKIWEPQREHERPFKEFWSFLAP